MIVQFVKICQIEGTFNRAANENDWSHHSLRLPLQLDGSTELCYFVMYILMSYIVINGHNGAI